MGKNLRHSGARDHAAQRVGPSGSTRPIPSGSSRPRTTCGNGRQAQFFSEDGGESWGQTTLPLQPGDAFHSDPTVDWTSDGTAWATTIGVNAGRHVLQMRAYRSTDGGKTWVFDGTFSGGQTTADKQFMWVDRGGQSPPRDDRIYVIWHNGPPAFVNRRRPTGLGRPQAGQRAGDHGTAIGSDITTNGKGDVFAVLARTPAAATSSSSSPPTAATITVRRDDRPDFRPFEIRIPSFVEPQRADLRVDRPPSAAPAMNDVYVSWIDLAGGGGCNTRHLDP